MKVAVFSTKNYDQKFLTLVNENYGHDLHFFEPRLTLETVSLAANFPAICVFVNDELNEASLRAIAAGGTKLIALRCAGFNNVNLKIATELGLTVVRVPAYSPYSVAEHTVGMILTLNRKLHRAYNRVREGNFALDGLLGFDLHGRTVGILGTGKIGKITAQILKGFGCNILGFDRYPDPQFAEYIGKYVSFEELIVSSDIISLHCPLTPETYHLINETTINQMKPGVMLVNTSRGGLIDTKAVIKGLKSHQIGYLAIDVYEQESDLFFEDLSGQIIQDDVFQRLLTFPNVLITGHQAFFTEDALINIAETTISNITNFEQGNICQNQVTLAQVKSST
jgi:D-lactate dehydrogenase